MRRTQNEMKSIEEICAVLDKCKVCRLAMNHNGYPYLVPMNFGYEREGNKIYLYFHGANAGTKKELIEKDGRVAFEMDVHEEARISSVACNSYMDYESVCGTGNAEIADLYLGKYYVKELTPPVGYLADPEEHDLECNDEGDLVQTVERTATSLEDVIKQPFQVIKAANNGKTDADLLKGVGFSAYLESSLKKNKDGSYDFTSATPVC